MNAALLRALVGASDSLRTAYLVADDRELRARIEQVAAQVAELVGLVVTNRRRSAQDQTVQD